MSCHKCGKEFGLFIEQANIITCINCHDELIDTLNAEQILERLFSAVYFTKVINRKYHKE